MKKMFLVFLLLSMISWCTGVFIPQFINCNPFFYKNDKPDKFDNIKSTISFQKILKNNLMVVFNNCIYGFFSFGIYSTLNIFFNGFVFGLFLNIIIKEAPISIILISTVPHFTEYIAIWLSGTLGLYGNLFFVRLIKDKKIIESKETYFLLLLILIIVILIIVSAYIESYECISNRGQPYAATL